MFVSKRPRVLVAALLAALAAPALRAAEPESAPHFATGLQFASEEAYRSIPLAAPPLMGTLPGAVDMASEFPTPGDQGEQGSCVGWAVAYAVRSRDAARRQGWRPDDPERVFSPAYVFNQINRSPSCQGSLYTDALELLTRGGVAPLAAFPYDPNDCRRAPDAAVHAAASAWRVQTWRRVNVQDTTEVKSHLAAGYPVLIGMMVDQGFQALRGDAVYATPYGMTQGGHALVLVGYDDGRQAFKVINSWGLRWGDRGFGWIGYGAFRQVVREGYVIQDFQDKVAPGPQPGPGPGPGPDPTPTPRQRVPVVSPSTLAPPAVGAIQTPYGPGAGFQVTGQLSGAQGHMAQVVIRFGLQQPNGHVQQIPANPQSPFRDFNGGVATGTQVFQVPSDPLDLSQLQIGIPLVAIGAYGTIVVQADVYVDGFNIARSTMGTMQLPAAPQLGQRCCDGFGRPWCDMPSPLPLGSGCMCYGVAGSGSICP